MCNLTYRSCSAEEPYDYWLFRGKRPATGRAANGGALAQELPRATGVGPELPRIVGHSHPFLPLFPQDRTFQTSDLKFDIVVKFEVKSQKKETSDLKKVEKGIGKGMAIIRGNSGPTPVAQSWLRG